MTAPSSSNAPGSRLVATTYDEWFDRPWGSYASSIERHALARGVAGGARLVLDVGCGTGRLTIHPANATVVGVDRAWDMLVLARGRSLGSVVQADADHLPFANGSFDLTTATTLCEFTQSAEVTINELVRVTRPGGQIVLGALNPASPWGRAHRRQFNAPPWSDATWLSERAVTRIGSKHGAVTTDTVLYAPGAAVGLARWGPWAERLGHALAPHHGAFIVATITVSSN